MVSRTQQLEGVPHCASQVLTAHPAWAFCVKSHDRDTLADSLLLVVVVVVLLAGTGRSCRSRSCTTRLSGPNASPTRTRDGLCATNMSCLSLAPSASGSTLVCFANVYRAHRVEVEVEVEVVVVAVVVVEVVVAVVVVVV